MSARERPPLPAGCTSTHERMALLVSVALIVIIWVFSALKDGRITAGEWWALGIGVGLVLLVRVTDAHRCIRATAPREE